MTKSIPLGEGSNLSVDDTSAKDNMPVAFYNCYRDNSDAIRSIPGCELFKDLNTGGIVYVWFSDLHSTAVFVSMGRIFIQTSSAGTPIEITGGNLDSDVMPCFVEDMNSIFVAANSYIHRITGTVLDILTHGPNNVTSMIFTTGFLMANGGGIDGDANFSDDGPGNIGARTGNYEDWEVYNNESIADPLQALVLLQNIYVYNFGSQSLEVSYIGSDPSNPFEVNKGRQSNLGTIAKHSVVYDGNAIYFLAKVDSARKIVKMAGGDNPQIISFGVDIPIEKFERVDDAEAFTMAFKGQNFYVLNFPTANVTIDEQYFENITLAWHIQKNSWRIFGKWNTDNGLYEMYRGASFVFIEPWGFKLIGGRDGKVYKLLDESPGDYDTEASFQHRWRDDNKKQWQLPRTVSLGKAGMYSKPKDQYRGGTYKNRQHEFIYTNLTDGGELFRMCVRSGQIAYGLSSRKKRSAGYSYDAQTGSNEFILNGVEEELEALA